MKEPDWGRWQVILGSWQVILAIIAITLALVGLMYQFNSDLGSKTSNNISVNNINNNPTTSTQETSSISVISSPNGASIYLDDIYEGETPKVLRDVEQGPHIITLKLAEYEDWSQSINVGDDTFSISPTLTPKPKQ